MKKHSHNKVVFKPYVMGQPSLMPADLEEMIPPDHVVRTINEVIEQIDLTILYAQYPGGGSSSYHPKMMLKILVYGYVEQMYSSRKIAKALRENVNFMWLSGQSQPDFRTINNFRGVVMKEIIGEIFAMVLELLIEQGHVKLATRKGCRREYARCWKRSKKSIKPSRKPMAKRTCQKWEKKLTLIASG